MPRTERDRELARRRKRKAKIGKLKKKYAETNNQGEKADIQAKVRKMSPFLNLEEVLKA